MPTFPPISTTPELARVTLQDTGECVFLFANNERRSRQQMRQQVRQSLIELIASAYALQKDEVHLVQELGTPPRLDANGISHFVSFSHAADLSCIAISRHRPLGLDLVHVDEIKGAQDCLDVAAIYLSPQVFQALPTVGPADLPSRFIAVWAEHEAVLKCLGLPLQEWSQKLALATQGVESMSRWVDPSHVLAIAIRPV
ncbi:hypothetical protein RF679_08815 [Undibacterium cyanobacteriorum]|uniref:4'-phosphopantetheinyl transferase domain-containing protein n=1 Tax=Undibacterium cyanobacteriorum TaxID=3073561 RepID=A0ABY9RQZ0_9BURK|nr:4'-phosphopantetheinyl transferase superfamily protein [Undibacterium sp. 20NA77.5]WMW82361.1 hypothetical protein RF679_08815 [Undibacterium sp. 20NA77.5]